MSKLTAKQTATLTRIWNERTACGLVDTQNASVPVTAITNAVAAQHGLGRITPGEACALEAKGMIQYLTLNTTHETRTGTFRVRVAVLTTNGRAALFV